MNHPACERSSTDSSRRSRAASARTSGPAPSMDCLPPGDLSSPYVDGGSALTVGINAQVVTVGRDGVLYIGDSRGVYRVNADGRIYKVGNGITMSSHTYQMDVTADGTLLLPDGDRIRAIASNNTVTTLVGGGQAIFRTPPLNGTLARAAGLTSNVFSAQIAPDGSVY